MKREVVVMRVVGDSEYICVFGPYEHDLPENERAHTVARQLRDQGYDASVWVLNPPEAVGA